jgi:hypothetical protein
MRKRHVVLSVLFLLAIVVPMILIKGNVADFVGYLQGRQSYLGSSLLKQRQIIKSDTLLQSIVRSENFEDFRRKHPDFISTPETVLNSQTTPQGLADYKGFLSRLSSIKEEDGARYSYQSVVKLTHLVQQYYKKNLVAGQLIEGGVLGRIRSHPEDYVYQLVNAKTACGTVGEATVALLRELGYKARLIIVSAKPNPLTANHILAETYVPELGQWIMVDPMIDYAGKESIFELIGNSEKALEISNRHGYENNIYSTRSVAWFDRRTPLRKIYYFTADQENHAAVASELAKID